MYKINYSLIAGILATALVVSGCTNEESLQNPGNVSPNSGTVSQTHFFIALDGRPTIFDLAANTVDLDVEVAVTATVADRNNQLLTDSHTVFFKTEWGIIEPSCVTVKGQCSIKWIPSGNLFPADNTTVIVAYTNGEEAFLDPNGNGTYDDGETFFDREEPWINIDSTENPWVYDIGIDIIIDTVNANDFTASNLIHDPADGLFNGGGCTHSTECNTALPSTAVWSLQLYDITGGTVAPAPATFTVGGNLAGLPGGETVTLQNNLGDDLIVNADGGFTFATGLLDLAVYDVTVSTQPASAVCTPTVNMGNIAGIDVTTVVVTCV